MRRNEQIRVEALTAAQAWYDSQLRLRMDFTKVSLIGDVGFWDMLKTAEVMEQYIRYGRDSMNEVE